MNKNFYIFLTTKAQGFQQFKQLIMLKESFFLIPIKYAYNIVLLPFPNDKSSKVKKSYNN